MPQITIVRPYEWANQQKKTDIYIDGMRVERIGIDQTVQFDVAPGKHKIELKQRWSGGSKPLRVNLGDNEDVTFKIKSFKYAWLIIIPFYIFLNSFYLTTTNIDNFIMKLMGSFAIAALLYLVFHVLFLRTKLIKLEEVEFVDSKKTTKQEQAF